MLSRRKFVAGSVAGIGALAATASRAQTNPKVVWKMGTSFPTILDTIHAGGPRLSQLVSKLTNGEFRIETLNVGEGAAPLAMFDAVEKGTVTCAHTAGYYYVGKNLAFAFETGMPFGFSARQHNAWMYEFGGLDLTRELYAKHNIVNFPLGNTGAQMGGWFKKEVKSVEDVQGLRIRVPGIGGQVWKRLGAEPIALPGGEIVAALKENKIDAAEWTVPYDDEKLGLPKVASHYYYPAWWEPSAQLSLFVNKKAWDALPEQYKIALSVACESVNQWMLAAYDTRNPKAYKNLVSTGTRIESFPNSLMIGAHREAFALYQQEAAKNAEFKKIYEPWSKYRNDVNIWPGASESRVSQHH
jgi:TRAP-type mannitol/chloroaromatic compound transport system substrate-binding protein